MFKTYRTLGILVAAVVLAACARPAAPPAEPPDNRAAEESTLRGLIQEWGAAAGAKDAAKFVSYYADDAVVMLEDMPDFKGMAAIRDGVTGMMQDPAFALSFTPDSVTVARAGDVAYETGTYSMSMTGPDKAAVTERGHYVTVWRKQPDGAWKVVIDAPLSDPAEAAPH